MTINKTKIGKVIFGLLSSGFIFISCHKSAPSWDAQILAPVVNASMSINDIITSSYIKNNPDSSVSLVYTDSLYNLNIDTLVTIPDTVLNYSEINLLGNYNATPGDELFYNKQTTTYPIGSVELTKGTLLSGFLVFRVFNPLPQPIDYYYKVLNVTKGTDTLQIYDLVVPANDSLTEQISLSGYSVDFSGPTHNSFNDITTSIQVNLDPHASPYTIPSGATIVSAKVSFTNIIPYYAKGYFGTTTKSFGPTNAAFPIFNKITSGTLNLQNVSVNLNLTNGFGVDASLLLSQLSSYNSRTNTTVNLVDNGVVGSTIHVNRAIPTNNPAPASPVISSKDSFAINPSNSNILAWLDNMPTAVGYALQVTTDPLGNVSGSNDFAYYGYGISANINVTIPLSLIASNLTLADTLAINFAGSSGTNQHVKSGTLTIYATNGFPFSAGLQLYFLNTSKVIYDSLFVPANQIIAAAPVNAITGIVINPQASVLTISLNTAQTQQLFNTKNMILHAKFNMGSLPSTYRKIYDYYQLNLKLVGNFDYQIN